MTTFEAEGAVGYGSAPNIEAEWPDDSAQPPKGLLWVYMSTSYDKKVNRKRRSSSMNLEKIEDEMYNIVHIFFEPI